VRRALTPVVMADTMAQRKWSAPPVMGALVGRAPPSAALPPAMPSMPSPAAMGPPPSPKAAAPQGEAMKKRKRAARDEAPGDELGAVFGRQLASGLWDDAALGADDDLRRLRATARVLRTLVERGVDTMHALYGVPLRKALEAVVAAVAALAAQDAATCERALGAAWLLAMGPRTRAAVEAAVRHGGYATLGSMAGDAARVRAWVLGPA